MIQPTPNQGEYFREIRRCILNDNLVGQGNVQKIALLIIHEATHAELMDRGIGYQVDIRQRVEEICGNEEIAFSRMLGAEDNLLADTEYRLSLPAESWSADAIMQREMDWAEREGEIPKWFLNLIARLHAWRMARHRRRTGLATDVD